MLSSRRDILILHREFAEVRLRDLPFFASRGGMPETTEPESITERRRTFEPDGGLLLPGCAEPHSNAPIRLRRVSFQTGQVVLLTAVMTDGVEIPSSSTQWTGLTSCRGRRGPLKTTKHLRTGAAFQPVDRRIYPDESVTRKRVP